MQTMAPTQLLIRPAVETDIEALRAVLARANEPFRGMVGDGLFASYLSSAMDVSGRLQEAEVLAAELDGRIVGTITYYRDAGEEGIPVTFPEGTAGIRATAVEPAARGRGIGAAMVTACVVRARESGARYVGLHTARFMVAAVAIYERSGFSRTPRYDFEWSQFFPGGTGEVEPALAYLRPMR